MTWILSLCLYVWTFPLSLFALCFSLPRVMSRLFFKILLTELHFQENRQADRRETIVTIQLDSHWRRKGETEGREKPLVLFCPNQFLPCFRFSGLSKGERGKSPVLPPLLSSSCVNFNFNYQVSLPTSSHNDELLEEAWRKWGDRPRSGESLKWRKGIK